MDAWGSVVGAARWRARWQRWASLRQRAWGLPLTFAGLVLVTVGVLGKLPREPGRVAATAVTLGVLLALWLVLMLHRPAAVRRQVRLVVAAGLAGSALVYLQPTGPGYLAGYLAVAAAALLFPLRAAVPVGAGVLLAVNAAFLAAPSYSPSGALNVSLGAGFVFAAAGFAARSGQARDQAEQLLAHQEATRAAREEALLLAERARLARELHDVLAATLAGLTVNLQAARLLADRTAADRRLVELLNVIQGLASDGMSSAKGAVAALRGEARPGPELLPALVAGHRPGAGPAASLQVEGRPRPLDPDVGLAVYRTVQEGLTNIAKHAGAGAATTVRLTYLTGAVEVEVTDRGGDGAGSAAPSGRLGLAGLAERAALVGGELTAGPTADGFRVRLAVPTRRGAGGAEPIPPPNAGPAARPVASARDRPPAMTDGPR